ncbi:MAG: hypothetical protein RLY31_638 [Bacteroidota bacterium]
MVVDVRLTGGLALGNLWYRRTVVRTSGARTLLGMLVSRIWHLRMVCKPGTVGVARRTARPSQPPGGPTQLSCCKPFKVSHTDGSGRTGDAGASSVRYFNIPGSHDNPASEWVRVIGMAR